MGKELENRLKRLRKRAQEVGCMIRKERLADEFTLIDGNRNCVIFGPADLNEIEERIAWEEAGE